MLANHYNLLPKYGDFKGRTLKICPKPPKNLGNFVTFFLGDFLGKFSKKFP
jgi:hypothetical protein